MKVVDNADCRCVRNGIPCSHDLALAKTTLADWFNAMFAALKDIDDMQWVNDTRGEAAKTGGFLQSFEDPYSALLRFLHSGQIHECRRLFKKQVHCSGEDMEKLILPWMPVIEKRLGQKMLPRYVAYLVIYLVGKMK